MSARVLLAEDNLINQEVSLAMLNVSGCRVTVVPNGIDAVESYRRGIFHRLEAGMDDYLSKPSLRARLAAVLRKWVKRELNHGESTIPNKTLDGPIDQATLKPIRELEERGNRGLLQRMIEAYMEESATLMSSIETGILEGDIGRICEAAHTLKSCSAHVGALNLSALAEQLQAEAEVGSSTHRAQLLVVIKKEYASVKSALGRERLKVPAAKRVRAFRSEPTV